MATPSSPAGRDLIRRHPELNRDEVAEVELQARGIGLQEEAARRQRVVDVLRPHLSAEQRAAVAAVMSLDPDAIAGLDAPTIRMVIQQLADSRLDQDPAARDAAQAAAARYLDEIM